MTEADDFAATVRTRLASAWPLERLRSGDGAGPLWSVAADAGWFDLAGEGSIAAMTAGCAELGAAACPLPLADARAAAGLVNQELRAEIAAGRLRVAVATAAPGPEGDWWRAELAGELDAVLTLDGQGAELRQIASAEPLPGVPAPAWSRVRLGAPMWRGEPDGRALDRARTLMRLGLAARATGAARRLHALAVAHARERVQFGRPIGSFGAVQQRVAACQIDAVAARLLIDSAAAALDAEEGAAELAAELAHGFAGGAARRVLLGAHHTLAAVAFFDEHPGPWLFRRVHADIAAAAALAPSQGGPVDRLVEGVGSLPDPAGDARGAQFRADVRKAIAEWREPDGSLRREVCLRELARRRWLGLGWPEEAGGLGAGVGEEVALNEELSYAQAPVEIEMASVMLLGGAILEHGSPEQRESFLPLIRAGEMRFCLGYSEPETGSDLASLRTRADPGAEGWIVNGQKIWTTRAEEADYLWLAARTDPEARPRHAGITVFLVPMSTPGIEVRPMTALSGERAATVFLDDVHVPDTARVGPLNGGWAVITRALAGERVLMGGVAARLHRVLDDVARSARADPDGVVGPRGSARRHALDEAACALQALRALVAHATAAEGSEALAAAPLAGVFGGELAESFAEALLDVLGGSALLEDPAVPGGGQVQQLLRESVMYVVGGGTNDIQRGLIARSLGLPR